MKVNNFVNLINLMIKFCNYLILYYFLDEDKNFCLEERNDIEQHNDLEISEGI